MTKLRFDISMSLDGFVAGPNQSVENPLGEGGGQLHEWAFSLEAWRKPHGEGGGDVSPSTAVVEESQANIGANLMALEGGNTFTFVTDGIESALDQAREAAGDKDVHLGGGASIAQQYLKAGLIDELHVNLVPVFLGGGARLFDNLDGADVRLECTRAIEAPGVTHLSYRVVK